MFTIIDTFNRVVLYYTVAYSIKQNDVKKLGLNINSKIYIVIGILTELKNPKIIVKSFKKFKEKNKTENLNLIFLGDGSLKEQCIEFTKGDPSISFLGFKDNVSEYLQASDFSISASQSEGFGLNFMESIFCGIPVIATAIGPFKEFYSIFPETSNLMFKKDDAIDIENKLEISLKSNFPMQEIREKAVGIFSEKKMSEEYQKYYEELI